MSLLETVLLFVALPAGIYLIIAGLSFLGKPNAGTAPKHFNLGDEWTRKPVLWSATDEVIGHGHHGHGAHELSADVIGGRASGGW